ncbi:MAG: GNAT family N-acetyltransferase [Pseudomonadota bacterium]
MNYHVVPMTEAHIADFHQALDSVAREHDYLAFLEAPPLDNTRDFVLHNIEHGRPQFVALREGRVVGWCDIAASQRPVFTHAGTLGMGIVAPHRGRGLGRTLLEATIAKARATGIERIELTVREKNARAIALYEKMGFVHEGRHVNSVKIGQRYENHLSMALWLGHM